MNTTSAALCSQSLTTTDLCYAVALAAKEGDLNRAFMLATGLHARIRELESQLRDEIATNAALSAQA